jgi:SAM-dependent methyltransferase
MRYFEAHEAIYARRLASGATGWDDGTYDAPALRNQVDRWFNTSTAAKPAAHMLELGCGTGALACMLAHRGFEVAAIDISHSAIAFARGMAAQRALHVQFEVADACTFASALGSFDVVIDSHLLHCIAIASERKQLLDTVARSLARGGEFWTETMVMAGAEDAKAESSRRMDADGKVWAKLSDPGACVDATLVDGSWWMPMRYIAPSAAALLAEFATAGLEVMEWSVQAPTAAGEAADFRGRFRRA